MKRVTVVGSGASAVHFAQSALERGSEVLMLDVGRARPPHVAPELGFDGLKRELPDARGYFLGPRFEGLLQPGSAGEYYGFPPHRAYVFEPAGPWRVSANGFEPLSSFARGGLAEAWTGGVFPYNAAELAGWPFGPADLAPHYDRVAKRIGVTGADDDLAPFVPVHAHMDEPLELDEHAQKLVARYSAARGRLNASGCFLGRSRVAVLREDRAGRHGCTKLGRCLWGCPRDALYTPVHTLDMLRQQPGFTYRDSVFVEHFEVDDGGKVRALALQRLPDGARETLPVERLALGAGTLASARIVLASARRAGMEWTLMGLMDNRQVMVPFVNLSMVGRRHDPDTYQYHQLALGLAGERPEEYVHGLVTTLKTALVHPIVQSVPFDLRASLDLFRSVHAALGLVNVNFHDRRRDENTVTLDPDGRVLVRYIPDAGEPERLRKALGRVRGALRALGCIVPPGMTHVRPMGASVHYAGLLPFSSDAKPRTTGADGMSRDFKDVWLVDGITLPFLPAKNLTFTLMANASRIATVAF